MLEHAMSAIDAVRRSSSANMTIGMMLDRLEAMPEMAEITIDPYGFEMCAEVSRYYKETEMYLDCSFGSYRGYYNDGRLGISTKPSMMTVAAVIAVLNDALSEGVMYGYKGGEYAVTRDTLVWLDEVSECRGVAPVGITKTDDENVVIVTDYVD